MYNRPALVRQALESLAANELADQSRLYIFSDGPKIGATRDQIARIEEVRKIIHGVTGFENVFISEADTNKGLAASVLDGVSAVIKDFGKVIVVEDDTILSPYFLRFMNDALNRYENNPEVFAVGGWNYFSNRSEQDPVLFFRYPDSIAWGTFARSWKLFEPDGKKLMQQLKERKLMRKFNGFRNLNYFERMLQWQIDGRVDSWAIRWTATSILHNGLTAFPPVSMAKKMGFSEESTHVKGLDYNAGLQLARSAVMNFPARVTEDLKALRGRNRLLMKHILPENSRLRRITNLIREQLPVSVHDLFFS